MCSCYQKSLLKIRLSHASVIFLILSLNMSNLQALISSQRIDKYSSELNTISEENNNTKMKIPMPSSPVSENLIISRDPNRIAFYLYPDPRNQSDYDTLLFGDQNSIKNSRFKPDLPVIFLIHGFLTSFRDAFIQTVKNAYLASNFPANIIAVDWGELSKPKAPAPYFYYNFAVKNVPIVGDRVANFTLFLLDIQAVKSTDDIHVVGFSLGAHASGQTGKRIIEAGLTPLRRITGLDPASPGFQYKGNDSRLDSTDARFVDIVHTNQGLKGYLGILGHVDFFPNGGGPNQPGCSNQSDISDVFTGVCSHARAYEYFAQSILNPNIQACKCDDNAMVASKNLSGEDEQTRTFVDSACMRTCNDPVTFGQYCPETARGVYYVKIQGNSRRKRKFNRHRLS